LRANRGFTHVVERRIFHLRQVANYDTQRLRSKWIGDLDGLFVLATNIAKGNVKFQRVNDKEQLITPKQRQMWAHVAAHIATVMGNLAKGYDERQFNEDLAELERLVDEIKGLQAENAGKKNPETQEKPQGTSASPSSDPNM
jgi:hypothetical protein